MRIPNDAPKPGFYYHFKHNPNGEVNNFAYEVLYTAFDAITNMAVVVYRALYIDPGYGTPQEEAWWVRPLENWNQLANRGGTVYKRFSKIEDPHLIATLTEIRQELYGA